MDWLHFDNQSSPSKMPDVRLEMKKKSSITQSVVIPIQQSSLVTRTQLTPDSIINNKQIPNRILNEEHSTSVTPHMTDRVANDHSNSFVR